MSHDSSDSDDNASDPDFLDATLEYHQEFEKYCRNWTDWEQRGYPEWLDKWTKKRPELAPQLCELHDGHVRSVERLGPRKKPEFIELESFENYVVGGVIDWGGTASIHEAVEKQNRCRRLAIKVPLLRSVHDSKACRRLEQEGKLTGMLQHPGIVPVYSVGTVTLPRNPHGRIAGRGVKLEYAPRRISCAFIRNGGKARFRKSAHGLTHQGSGVPRRDLQALRQEPLRRGRQSHPRPISNGLSGETMVPYFVMRLIVGEKLSTRLKHRNTDLDAQFGLIQIFKQICDAVAHAHRMGVIHCDLKPGNIMIGEYDDPYVIDWGFAVTQAIIANISRLGSELKGEFGNESKDVLEDDIEDLSKAFGTWQYMDQEIFSGGRRNASKKTDVFGLGGILCEILTGAPPFMSSSRDLSHAILKLDECPDRQLASIAKACLSPKPEDRPKDAGEVAEQVSEYIRAQIDARVTAERRLRRLYVLVGIGLAIMMTGFLILYQRSQAREHRQKLLSSAVALYEQGHHKNTRELLQKMELTALPFDVLRIRASFCIESREKLIQRVQGLIDQAPGGSTEEAELEFLLGDLLACDEERLDEGSELLKRVTTNPLNTLAAQAYARALLSGSMQECVKHLDEALRNEPRNHRANVVRCAALLSLGRVAEASQHATLLKQTFGEDRICDVVLETCESLLSGELTVRYASAEYAASLKTLLAASAGGMETLTFERQSIAAACVAELLEQLPSSVSSLGLPVAVFRQRTGVWNDRAAAAKKLATPGLIEQVWNAFVHADNRLAERAFHIAALEQLAADDPDTMANMMLASAAFVEWSRTYDSLTDDARKAVLLRMREFSSRSIEGETLLPRNQFEMASRVLRILADYNLRRYHADDFTKCSVRIRDDLHEIFTLGASEPQFLAAICALLSEAFMGFADAEVKVERPEDIILTFQLLSDWITAVPGDQTEPRIRRARLWHAIGRHSEALGDIEFILGKFPNNATALKLKDQILQAAEALLKDAGNASEDIETKKQD